MRTKKPKSTAKPQTPDQLAKPRLAISLDASPVKVSPSFIKVREILAPIDFSVASKKALKYAESLASLHRARLTLLYVVEPITFPADFNYTPLAVDDRRVATLANDQLEKLASQTLDPSITRAVAVRTGKPYREIIAAARELRSDLIVIATLGRTGLERLLMGSTAERVVHQAPCPVVVLPD